MSQEDSSPGPVVAVTTVTDNNVSNAEATEGAVDGSPTNSNQSNYKGSLLCCSKLMDGNPNAIAFLLSSIATYVVVAGSSAFFATALIKLAKNEAGCSLDDDAECNTKVHGLKPSSLLTTISTIVGAGAAILMPMVGAIVDTTTHRRLVGRIFSVLFIAALFPTIFVNENNWFIISITYALVAFTGYFETMCLFAYMPELSDNEATFNRYTRTISVGAFASMILYLALVIGITSLGTSDNDENNDTIDLDNDIRTARIAQSISFALAAVSFLASWGFLLQPRPAARARPATNTAREWLVSLWKASFGQLYHTAVKVHHHHRAVQWFFVAVALGDAALGAVFVLSATFLTDVLNFSASQNGVAVVILMVSCIPGGLFSYLFTHRFNPVASSIVAITILLINTTLVAIILHGPEQEMLAYLFAIPWGIGIGWKVTVDRILYAMILPKSESNYAEFAGAYIFFRFSLSWLPPLVFTLLNEKADISVQGSMASLDIFFGLALLTYICGVRVDSYAQAVADAKQKPQDMVCAASENKDDNENGVETASGSK